VNLSRPLPRVHAISDAGVLALDDLGVRAAALASGGSAVALHARDRTAPTRMLTRAAERFIALSRPPEASVFVNGRPDIAAAVHAHGIQLGRTDLAPADARQVFTHGWIGRSVHSVEEAMAARAEGADYLMVGTIYPTPSHHERAAGLPLVEACASLGLPVIAIGGVTAACVPDLLSAGAYGVAAVRALWLAADPAKAVIAFLDHWS
jgi:thiamine-phosphate pyrophosphorylase